MNTPNSMLVRTLLLGTSCFFLLGPGMAAAQPAGGQVTLGTASITSTGANSTVIDQKTGKAIITWDSFSIGAGGTVRFNQPDASSITLNRVLGTDASSIYGNLLANGQVWIVNRNGVLFGQGSRIAVGGLIATTSDITDGDFAAGNYDFSGGSGAAVTNQGTIRTHGGGGVVLSGASVSNRGLIQADTGTVILGGASAFAVDFAGDGLIQYAITQPAGGADNGRTGVSNAGTIQARGGHVVMTARAAADVQDAVVNNTGMISATSASVSNGEVVLDGGDGDVNVGGTVDASGTARGQTGGDVAVTGRNITIADNATIDASGDAGGGTVKIGGDLHGEGALQDAANTRVGHATIRADAIRSGSGGTLVVWSNGVTDVDGGFSARGVSAGGYVETSGHTLHVGDAVTVDTRATHGQAGDWLLDPENVTISSDPDSNGSISGGTFTPTGDNSVLNATTLQNALLTGNVTVTTGSTGSQAGDITVNAPVNWADTELTLNAAGAINVNAALTATGGASIGSLSLNAGGNVEIAAPITTGTSGFLSLIAGGEIAESGGGVLTAPRLTGNSGGVTYLNQVNAINQLSAFSANGLVLVNGGSLSVIAGVNSGTGVLVLQTTNSGSGITLNAPTVSGSGAYTSFTAPGGLTQSSNGTITATRLLGSFGGAATLTNTGNAIDLLYGFSANGLSVTSSHAMTVVGTLNSGTGNLALTTQGNGYSLAIYAPVSAPTTSGGTVTLTSAGDIAENSAGVITTNILTGTATGAASFGAANVVATFGTFHANGILFADNSSFTAGSVIDSGTGDLTLSATGSLTANQSIITPGTLTATAGGNLTLTGAIQAARVTGSAGLTAIVTAHAKDYGPFSANQLTLQPSPSGSNANATISGALTGLTELDLVGVGVSVTINAPITGVSGGTMIMSGSGNISQGSAGIITASHLQIQTTGDIHLTAANQVDNLTTAKGASVQFTDNESLQLSGSTTGVVGSSGVVVLTTLGSGNDLLVQETVSSPNNYVDLVAGGNVTESGSGLVNTPRLLGSSGGSTTLNNANNAVNLLYDYSAVGFSLQTSQTLSVLGAVNAGSGPLTITINGTGQNVLQIIGDLSTAGTMTLNISGSMEESGASSAITANLLNAIAVTGIDLSSSLNDIANLGTIHTDSGTVNITQ